VNLCNVVECLWITAGSSLFSCVLQFLQALWVIQTLYLINHHGKKSGGVKLEIDWPKAMSNSAVTKELLHM
jgi:hypothetical protein